MKTPYDEYVPEECPVCGNSNWDDVKQQILHASEVYCSDECQQADAEWNRIADDAYAKALLEEQQIHKMLSDWEAYHAS